MKHPVVARNYAEALLAVAEPAGEVGRFGELLDLVAGAIRADATIHAVLMSPRVPKTVKQQLLSRALQDIAPQAFVRFLAAVVQRGRHDLLGDISEAYQDLVDQHLNRVHASVLTAHAVDDALAATIASRLSAAVGKTVVPHFREDRSLIGGVIVRVGDRVFDGSLRRRIRALRQKMMHG